MPTSVVRAVTYIGLPISSGGAHSLGRMSRRVAYARTSAFLATCTEPVAPLDHRFRLERVPQLPTPAGLRLGVQRRFGDDARLPTERVPEALDFLDEIDPQPANAWGMVPVWFWTTSTFRLLDPATGRPIHGQDPAAFGGAEYDGKVPLGTSALWLILNDHAGIGIRLCVPAADDDLVRRVVPWLQANLPFRFSPKQWREWTPTKGGSWRARKLPSTPGT